ncbi:hypothetical protein N7495_006237 [Penicillium taxi]|uniref:uncharacterized protein n=1 Tax=Penicillium taxi TaxID=168475 RepID=UPI00254526BE|nr:uncharacterized protein N7495_006237 [Penicillium taxi]KAJ5894546.1 hypothetical protein N7495_006237 [Penicillium taxi]
MAESCGKISAHPQIPEDKLVLYVKKASPTSTANTVKPLMLIEALEIPHTIHIVASTSNETWFHSVNPYKMVPAMEGVDIYQYDGKSQRLNVFDSSACLIYLAEKYDNKGLYIGKDICERTVVMNWLMSYTAGLGATGKTWLLMKAVKSVDIGESLSVLLKYIQTEYQFLETRLNEPDQDYIALPDRPTLADFAILPLANEGVAKSADLEFTNWPKLKEWSERMSNLPPVERALNRISRFGISDEELMKLNRQD